ncbi:HTTM domain-containing protein [Candidatus Gracilibacteria bacterium]|nr:HTTM domain-containing protein [Candidatus Gracilibacteria bacterium]
MAQTAISPGGAGVTQTAAQPLLRWRSYLLADVDGASLALFRILFGVVMAWEVVRYFENGWIARYYIEPSFFFSYLPFIQPWPGDGMYWHFAATGLLALMVAAGLFYRVAAWLFCLAFSYIFLLDKAQYLNHFYLIALLSLLMALAPAQRAWSLDGLLKPGTAPVVPRWSLLLLRFQVAIVYFYGGIAKLNSDWLSGQPLDEWLARRDDLIVIGPLLAQPWSGLAFAWGGLLIDLCVPLLLLWPRTFWLGAAAAVGFNALNGQIFSIGIFPWLMVAALVLFPQPGWPRTLLGRQLQVSQWPVGVEKQVRRSAPAIIALLVALHVYALGQLLIPLRHWLYPSDVAWSEEGHRFAWRMKLRDKDADLVMFASDPVSGERQRIEPRDWITARQEGKMATRPDMIQQFAHFVADEHERRGAPRPQITVFATASLNGGPASYLIDPHVDLASTRVSLGPANWIMPREQNLLQ